MDRNQEETLRAILHGEVAIEATEMTEAGLLQALLAETIASKQLLQQLVNNTNPKPTPTPTSITFKEITMNPEGPGVTQVWTGTLSPAGSAYPAGTTFTGTPTDTTVTVTIDPTGLIVTIAYPTTFVPNPTTPFSVAYASSTFTPVAPGTATSVSGTITPSVPVPPTSTPNSINFTQTS